MSHTEFKSSLAERDSGLEALCGMLNTDAGVGFVYFGVDPRGKAVGLSGDLDKAQRSIADAARDGFDPKVPVEIEVLTENSLSVVRITAQRSSLIPLHAFKARVWIREGSSTRALTLLEQQQLVQRRARNCHQGPWRCDKCGSYAGMLMQTTVGPNGIERSYKCQCGGEYWPAV